MSRALEEKQRLIADILHIPMDDFDHIVDMASQPSPERDAKEVLLAALAQGETVTGGRFHITSFFVAYARRHSDMPLRSFN